MGLSAAQPWQCFPTRDAGSASDEANIETSSIASGTRDLTEAVDRLLFVPVQAEVRGEDRFGADRRIAVQLVIAGSCSDAAGSLPRAAAGARVSVPGVPATAPRIRPRTIAKLRAACASRAGDCCETAIHAAQPGESGNGAAAERHRGRPPVLLVIVLLVTVARRGGGVEAQVR
jgi:hypothetical protein